jgi:hypothetical protein
MTHGCPGPERIDILAAVKGLEALKFVKERYNLQFSQSLMRHASHLPISHERDEMTAYLLGCGLEFLP